jgi:hypothetical protein
MKRPASVLFAALLALGAAACGGDDDDTSSASASGSGSGSTAEESSSDEGAASGDFCEIWPSLSADSEELTGEPTEEQIDEARAILDSARDAAPEEIEDEVTQMVGAIEGIVDTLAEGNEPDAEEMFGEIFALAFTVGPPIEEWMVENCPDYDPQEGFDDENSFDDEGSTDDEFTVEFEAFGLGDADIRAAIEDVFGDSDNGLQTSSGVGDESWAMQVDADVSAEDAIAACESLSETFASHADATGVLELTIADSNGTALAVNAEITPGNPGTCEAA